jgi:hypothetical protein
MLLSEIQNIEKCYYLQVKHFSLLQNAQTCPVAKLATCSLGTRVLSARVKWSFRVEAKNEWSFTSTPLNAIIVWTEATLPLPPINED